MSDKEATARAARPARSAPAQRDTQRAAPAPLRLASVNADAPSVLTALHHLDAGLPPVARRIAGYIRDHAQDVIHMSITDLADQAGVSEGSIVGFCRRLGASGFQELKILLSRDLVEPVRFIQEDLQEGDSSDRVSDCVFSAHAASLAETRKLLTAAALDAAVAMVRSARRIEVYGIGSAASVAEDLAYRLLQIGYDVKAVTDSHIQAVSAAMTGPGVTTITISHSGSTKATVLATRLAHEAGATTLGISRLGKSPLQRHCDAMLYTVARETLYRPEAMSSRAAQLALVDTLVSCCALAESKRTIPKLELSARVLAEKRF